MTCHDTSCPDAECPVHGPSLRSMRRHAEDPEHMAMLRRRLDALDAPCPTCENTGLHPAGDPDGLGCWDCERRPAATVADPAFVVPSAEEPHGGAHTPGVAADPRRLAAEVAPSAVVHIPQKRHVLLGDLDTLEFAIADYIARWGEQWTGRRYDGNIAGLPCAVANMAMTVIRKNLAASWSETVAVEVPATETAT